MKSLLLALSVGALSAFSSIALGASIDPATTSFPWMNGPARDSVYNLADNTNKVHVLEVWRIDCSWCNRNAEQVQDLANEYAGDASVQFLDMGIDSSASAYTQWIQRHAPSYPVVKDVNRAVFNALHQEDGVPQTYVVDCTGTLVDYTIGYWGDAERDTLRAAIARAKQTTCP